MIFDYYLALYHVSQTRPSFANSPLLSAGHSTYNISNYLTPTSHAQHHPHNDSTRHNVNPREPRRRANHCQWQGKHHE